MLYCVVSVQNADIGTNWGGIGCKLAVPEFAIKLPKLFVIFGMTRRIYGETGHGRLGVRTMEQEDVCYCPRQYLVFALFS